MKKFLLLLLPIAFALAGCKYDDTDVWDELNAQKAKIAALENSVASVNTNIGSLQSVIQALQSKVTVNSVTKTDDGYVIAFSDGTSATISNGKDGKDGVNGNDGTDGKDGVDGKDGKDGVDGKDGINGKDGVNGKDGIDGKTPQIGAKADEDGLFYWTVNGEWLMDASGKKVSTSNTPKVKIEDDQWMVSYDDGTSWSKVEGQGPSATCVFESVTTTGTDAVFTLADGTVISVPLTGTRKLQLIFDETVFSSMRDGELLSTAYTITSPEGAKVDIETFESDGWTVTFRPTDETKGRISIQAPAKVTPSKILFLLTDNNGGTFIKIINIGLNESEKPAVQTEYTSDFTGGQITIPIVSSTAEISEGGDWIELVSVGDEVVVNISANETYDRRSSSITLEDGTVVTITQTTEDAIVLSKEVVEIDGRRQLVAFVVNSNITVKANVVEGSDWLSVSPSTRGLNQKIFTFTAKRNTTEEARTAKVEFSGHDITKTCTVNQAVFDGDPTMDVTEAAASDEGDEVELKPSFVVAVTEDGYVVAGGGSYIFAEGSHKADYSAGDSVTFKATATKFNGLPALGSIADFTEISGKHAVLISGKDITSTVDSYSNGVPTAVKITGDLTIDGSGNYNLTVKGAKKKVVIYKPATYIGLSAFNGYNITLTGIYYGEADGAINIIAVSYSSNGVTMKEGDPVTVSQFISLAKTDIKLKLTGTVSNYNKNNCRFDLTDESGTIYVYSVTNKSDWSSKMKDGGTVELLGKYQYYEKDSKHEVVDAEIISFTAGSSEGTTTGYQYKKATSVTSGKSYLIVALDGSKAYVGKPITSNYGYISVDEATDENGVITMTSKSNEYVITESNGQYTIAQSDGKLLYQTGTYTSFNVNASPSEGQYWDIKIGNDGTATITNAGVNKYVQYSTGHSSFGSYASAQSGSLMPVLYEYVGETEVTPGDEPGDDPGTSIEGKVFQKVTSNQSDWSGEYLIVYEGAGVALDGSQDNLKGTQATPCVISVSIDGGTIAATTTTTASTFTVTKSGSSYVITSASGLPIGNTNDSNDLKCSKSGSYTNSISYGSDGVDIDSSGSHLRFNNNANGGFFRYYKSTSYANQQAIQLYKLVTE